MDKNHGALPFEYDALPNYFPMADLPVGSHTYRVAIWGAGVSTNLEYAGRTKWQQGTLQKVQPKAQDHKQKKPQVHQACGQRTFPDSGGQQMAIYAIGLSFGFRK